MGGSFFFLRKITPVELKLITSNETDLFPNGRRVENSI